ncbi:hypothetical protein AALP_AA6G029200 [Arabis alpina]|uniref:Gnk2-homologous domain-containing protein n=1 Tax=Arabis alpina TaxID=50452 RepID=A0A087GLQ9_ARAAL|nr:hypothetical protein AALP_AA6G029200 [Arabis alpina]
MSCRASIIFLFLFSFLTSFSASAQDPVLNHVCSDRTTYSRNSTYSNNLQTLLSSLSLSSANTSYSTGFQNATAGQNTDMVYGLFLCRGDLSPESCLTCVAFSANEILIRCPIETQAVLYSDECMLRYSDKTILSTLTTDRGVMIPSTRNVPPNYNYRKFDARKVIWTTQQTLYGLVQCTPDLTKQDCLRCLQLSINQLPTDKIGGRVLYPSCSSRYEVYAFYNETTIRRPSP